MSMRNDAEACVSCVNCETLKVCYDMTTCENNELDIHTKICKPVINTCPNCRIETHEEYQIFSKSESDYHIFGMQKFKM